MTVIQLKSKHPNETLKIIAEHNQFVKFALVYITKDGAAVYEQRNMGQRDLAWASLIVGKHATEATSEEYE